MSTHLFLEAALRSLVMGVIISVALRILRIDQVRARRTAWLLALAGALAMPAMVGAQIGPRLLPEIAPPRQQSHLSLDDPYIAAAAASTYREAGVQHATLIEQARDLRAQSAERVESAARPQLTNIVLTLAEIGYCAVAAVLSLRLCAGVGFALRLRNQAQRVVFPFDSELDVRTSSRIATPVTIGSSVLLPSGYVAWDEATLRIVLSHERAHVRQADFYVHALAGLHCALFWFNPFSWWLQRQLSELGEALSDCAAVEHAESRASYAETLLAFASRARWPLAGVAMASASNLTPRIERLLSDRGFERSFAVKHRLPYVAAGVVMMALVASTSMVRVQAAPSSGLSSSSTTKSNTTANANLIATLAASVTPNSGPATNANADEPKDAGKDIDTGKSFESFDKDTGFDNFNESETGGDKHQEGIVAIHTDHSNITFDTGNLLAPRTGDYIYFQHDGKLYLIQDPSSISQAQVLLAPMKDLGEQQKALGKQQAVLGVQQRALGAQQRAFKVVDTPEFKRNIAELQNLVKQMNLTELSAQVNQQVLGEMQAHLGEIQARVGELQTEFGLRQGQFGEQQSKLGEQQGKLGEQQSLLAERQRKLVEDIRRQLKPIIEQAIREGKGKALAN